MLLHGFPQDWTEYESIMPQLAKGFTVVAVDLPGIGLSAPAKNGYDAAHIAADIHGLAFALKLDHPYLVGHDLGGIVTYAYLRQFADSLRSAMILDVPMPGIAGWEEATSGMWHIGFIQTPDLPEKMVTGKQPEFIGHLLDIARFTPKQRNYYFTAYGANQLHAAFEIYRAFPEDGKWNASRTESNSVPLTVATGERSFFAGFRQVFVDGYRAKGMTHVESASIANASHYLIADNPQAVADLIEQKASIGVVE
jgi:pimeloyl-ACP methyl ester carboxylesterase